MESSSTTVPTATNHFYHQILSNHTSSTSPSKASSRLAPSESAKMILEANSTSSSSAMCSSPLVQSAVHLPLETMAKLMMPTASTAASSQLGEISSSTFSCTSLHPQSQSSSTAHSLFPPQMEKWTAFSRPQMAIAIANLRPSRPAISALNKSIKSRAGSSVLSSSTSSTSTTSTSWTAQALDLAVGDVLVVVEHFSSTWLRGYREEGSYGSARQEWGIFPSSYVWMENSSGLGDTSSSSSSFTSYYNALLDPLYLQVVRTLREWHQHLLAFYRANAQPEKYQAVRKLMAELIETARRPLGRELSPTLWRRRTSSLLKSSSGAQLNLDPYAKLLYSQDEDEQQNSSSSPQSDLVGDTLGSPSKASVLEPSLEELYDRVLSKLNQGNQLLGLEVMPSFTHGTFASDTVAASFAGLTRRRGQSAALLDLKRVQEDSVKFAPYYARENSKYLPSILAYYSRLSRKFTSSGGSGGGSGSRLAGGGKTAAGGSLATAGGSFHSPMHSSSDSTVGGGRRGSSLSLANSQNPSSPSSTAAKKHRRHLLLSIREVNFSSLFSSLIASAVGSEVGGDPHQSHSPLLQIDVYVIRANGGGGSSSSSSFSDSSSASSSSLSAYEVLTEKFVYRVRASGQPLVLHGTTKSSSSQSRALFLDVLSRRSNSSSSSAGSSSSSDAITSSSQQQQYDQNASQHVYLVVQVWRYGRMLLSEGRGKNSSVFHTISGSSLASSASSAVAAAAASAAASTTSLSSLTSFVSASTTSFFHGGDKTSNSATPSSSTPDSSSIDSSAELQSNGSGGGGGGSAFKRAVGFAVVPLLELVSRDQELKASGELLRDQGAVVSRVLLADESALLAVPIRLYEGDLTASALETVLKHRQQMISNSASAAAINGGGNSAVLLSSGVSSSSSSAATISKLSQVPPASYQLVVCAKFVSELVVTGGGGGTAGTISPKISSAGLDTSSSATSAAASSTSSSAASSSTSAQSSLADWLLLSGQCSPSTKDSTQVSPAKPSLNFAVVQKRFFGDLITAGYFRNDLYLTLEGAEFEKGGKAIPKNIEVAICLITERGVQERALSAGANDEPVTFYRSAIQYHQNSPRWAEHVKVNVPLELFESAHLRFTFAHCSSRRERERKLVGFSFLPLVDAQANGACLPDGERELLIYRVDSERKLDEPAYYLGVPWCTSTSSSTSSSTFHSNFSTSSSSIATAGTLVSSSSSSSAANSASSSSLAASSALISGRSSKEVFHLRTNLVSSKLTQNADILSLLKWSCTPLETVYESLARLGRVPGEEIVKFLEDVMDALFTLFTHHSSELEAGIGSFFTLSPLSLSSSSATTSPPHMTIIFRVLVDVFRTLSDPKFASYRAALEGYIEAQFSAPLVHTGLLACLRRNLELVIVSFASDASGTPPSLSGPTKREMECVLRCLSVFDWLLKALVQSRLLYAQAVANGGQLEASPAATTSEEHFHHELFSLFGAINRLLAVESKSADEYLIIAIQEAVLGTLPAAFPYLLKVLPPLELAQLVKSIVSARQTTIVDGGGGGGSPVSSHSITPTNHASGGGGGGKKTIVGAKLQLLQETIRCKAVWADCEEARLELLDTFIRLLNLNIAESRVVLSILQDVVLYLLDHSPGSGCRVRRFDGLDDEEFHGQDQNSTARHACEREIEMLSFGATDAIVEHILELTGVVGSNSSSLDFTTTTSSRRFSHQQPLTSRGSTTAEVESALSIDYLGSYLLCLLILLDRMSVGHYERLFERRSPRQCRELLMHLFMVFLNALYYYADGWLEVKMAVNRVLLQALTLLRRRIMSGPQEFLATASSCNAPSTFDLTLWRTYFKLTVAYITQGRLQMEAAGGAAGGGDSSSANWALPFWKRRLLVDTYGGDLRLLMGTELVAAWRSLALEEKAAFISASNNSGGGSSAASSLVASLVDVTLVQQTELRQATLPLLYDLLAVDWAVNGDFKQVEAALIEKFDALAHKAEADLAYREMFTQVLTEQIETQRPVWRLEGLELVGSLSRLLRLLVDYRTELRCRAITTTTTTTTSTTSSAQPKPEKITEVDDSLLMCTYTLLRFFQDEGNSSTSNSSTCNSNRRQIMLRYVDRLASLHKLQGNYTEAAFTLKLHADQLSWSSTSSGSSSSSECSRKEALSQTILDYLERGQCWEEGLAVCKQLAAVYEANYAYAKLAAVLRRSAHFLERILSAGNSYSSSAASSASSAASSQQPPSNRTDSEYFRVSFYGLAFASYLQNSTFIYRGRPYEKLADFTARLQREFPAAQLLTKSGSFPSDESITESYSQYIQIFAVKPVAEPPVTPDQHSRLLFGTPEPAILDYYASNAVRQFLQDRPVQRAPFDPTNEFKSLWIERTVYATERPLPGVMRMFAVVATSVHYLAPVENACETIDNMNAELGRLIARFSCEATRPESVSPLSMRLQGILEAAVNGGIAKYIDAFLGAEFLGANPDQVANVTLLKSRIAAQIKLVENGLTLHGRLAPTAVRPLHTRLLERFATMRKSVNQANVEVSQALLWSPALAGANHQQQSSHPRPSILSQPLPPIPLGHLVVRQDTASSDPETSSISSSSSHNHSECSSVSASRGVGGGNGGHQVPQQPPPPPPQLGANHCGFPVLASYLSPNSKTLKKKPLPPLPPPSEDDDDRMVVENGLSHRSGVQNQQPPHQRHHSLSAAFDSAAGSGSGSQLPLRSRSRSMLPAGSGHCGSADDSAIYAVPQLPEGGGGGLNGDAGSSVDDDDCASDDYYDEQQLNMQSVGGSSVSSNGHGHHPQQNRCTTPRGGGGGSGIYRSRSIPRSHYNGGLGAVAGTGGSGLLSNGGSQSTLNHHQLHLPPLQRGQSNANLSELPLEDRDSGNGGVDLVDGVDLSGGPLPPPPLPPRSSAAGGPVGSSSLDRSNSLNSGVILRSSPVIPPLIPPALPQRRAASSSATGGGLVRKSSSTSATSSSYGGGSTITVISNHSGSSSSSVFSASPAKNGFTHHGHQQQHHQPAHSANLDGIEFENLVISSPTPRGSSECGGGHSASSSAFGASNRPAPIIGIEIGSAGCSDIEQDLFPATPLITATTSSSRSSSVLSDQGTFFIDHHQRSSTESVSRSKSNSLPRSLLPPPAFSSQFAGSPTKGNCCSAATSSSSSSTVLEKFESKIVSKMVSTAVAVVNAAASSSSSSTLNGVSITSSSSTTITTKTFLETNSSLLD